MALMMKKMTAVMIPLYATVTNDSLIPVPDFALYQDQAESLDLLSDRIDGLIKALQVKGVYDGSLGLEIARLFTDAANTDLRPIKNWQNFAEKNGLKGIVRPHLAVSHHHQSLP